MRLLLTSLAYMAYVEYVSSRSWTSAFENAYDVPWEQREPPDLLESLGRILLALNPSPNSHALRRLQEISAHERRYLFPSAALAQEISPPEATNQERFGPLSVSEDFSRLLKEAGYHRPMLVQEKAMGMIAEGLNLVIHSATGSGKTLAFLAPLLAPIQANDGLRVVIVVPSQELAVQIATEATKLLPSPDSRNTRVLLAISATRELEFEQQDKLFASAQVPQVVVGTPQRLYEISGHPRARPVLRNLQTLVLDEVDSMIPGLQAPSESSGRFRFNATNDYNATRRLEKKKPAELFYERLSKLRSRSAPPLQVISSSATITSDMRRKLGTMLGGAGKAAAGKVVSADPPHTAAKRLKKFGVGGVQLPSTIKHTAYIGTNFEQMFKVALVEHHKEGQVLVVVGTGQSVRRETEKLRRMGFRAVTLQESLGVPRADDDERERVRPEKDRTLQDTMFTRRADLAANSEEVRKSLDERLIVTNEQSARGMDLKGIKIVVVYGVPHNPDSYIHVVGRTAREGRKGKAIYLLTAVEDMERLADFRNLLGMKIEERDVRFL